MKITARTRDVVFKDEPVDLSPVAGLSQLRSVDVRSPSRTALSLAPLRKKPVEKLKLVLPALESLDLAPLAGNKALTEVALIGGPPRVDLAPLARCSGLEQVFLFDTTLAEVDLAPLAKTRKLSLIWILQTQVTSLDLRPLAKLPALRALVLSDSKCTRIELGTKRAFAALTHLHVNGNPLACLDVSALAPGSQLRALTLPAHLEGTIDLAMLPKPTKRFEIRYS